MRVVIHPKEFARATGRSLRWSQSKFKEVRDQLGKPKGGLLTIKEVCNALEIDEKELRKDLEKWLR